MSTEGMAYRVSFDLVFRGERPWRIWDYGDTLEEAEENIRRVYGNRFNPPLRFRRVRAEDRDGVKVAGAEPLHR